MARHTHILIVLGLIGAVSATAQPPLPPGPDGAVAAPITPASDFADDVDSAPSEGSEPLDGDVITFKNGKKLERVQIVRESPAQVEVQVAEGVPPMKIRRSQIAEIQYDDFDPNKPGSKKMKGNGRGGEVEAEPLAPELNEKLGMEVKMTPRDIPGRDLVRVLGNVARELEVPLEFSEAVQQLPPDARTWTILIAQGTTLRMLLETDVTRDFPNLSVNYQFDKIVIDLRPVEAE